MRRIVSHSAVVWALAILVTAPGCLSLGLGTTTYVHEKPDTLARIDSLERRVTQLESSRVPVAPEAIPAGEPRAATVIVE